MIVIEVFYSDFSSAYLVDESKLSDSVRRKLASANDLLTSTEEEELYKAQILTDDLNFPIAINGWTWVNCA